MVEAVMKEVKEAGYVGDRVWVSDDRVYGVPTFNQLRSVHALWGKQRLRIPVEGIVHRDHPFLYVDVHGQDDKFHTYYEIPKALEEGEYDLAAAVPRGYGAPMEMVEKGDENEPTLQFRKFVQGDMREHPLVGSQDYKLIEAKVVMVVVGRRTTQAVPVIGSEVNLILRRRDVDRRFEGGPTEKIIIEL